MVGPLPRRATTTSPGFMVSLGEREWGGRSVCSLADRWNIERTAGRPARRPAVDTKPYGGKGKRGLVQVGQLRHYLFRQASHRALPLLPGLPLVAHGQQYTETADVVMQLAKLVCHVVGAADDPDVVDQVLYSHLGVGHVPGRSLPG